MNRNNFDITLLTDRRYVAPKKLTGYVKNILDEDRLVQEALEKRGLIVTRKSWDDPEFDWSSTKFILFRTTWDYFDRFAEFSQWLTNVAHKTRMINPRLLIDWNIDKHYLAELAATGIHIPPTLFIKKGDERPLKTIVAETNWKEIILKPVVSGAARHTYRFLSNEIYQYEDIFRKLIEEEDLMLQEYQQRITSHGEVAFMLFGGKFSHAVLKKAKPGDFRVQDDFGGTLHEYTPTEEEIIFAEKCVSACPLPPVYARADVLWDNEGNPALGELELIEPELWFRREEKAAERFADAIQAHLLKQVPV